METKNDFPVACFALPLTDDVIARYEEIIQELPSDRAELKDAMKSCLDCVKAWWELPDSTQEGEKWKIKNTTTGKDQTFSTIPLETHHVTELWEVTPWMRNLVAMEPLLGAIPMQEKELRDAAWHLQWFCKEITLDREPVTKDKVV